MVEVNETTAKAAATREARRLATGFRVNDRVHVECPGSPRFNGRLGTVVTTNLGEVGVTFGAGDAADAWFRPAELTRVLRP